MTFLLDNQFTFGALLGLFCLAVVVGAIARMPRREDER